MTTPIQTSTPPRSHRRWLWLAAPLAPVTLAGGAIWWFTEPLEDHPAPPLVGLSKPSVSAPQVVEAEAAWPETRMEGDQAKRLLLSILTRTVTKLGRHEGYAATFRKQERIDGVLLPEQTMAMKVRNHPFAIYLKFVTPKPGKEVVFAEGHHDNKLIAHNGDWTRRLVPRLAVAPDSAVALADCRHPITDAGLVNLAEKLLKFRRMDLADDDAVTILERTEDGRWLRSIHTHSIPNDDRPFARAEVLYDPKSLIPTRISNYDWPQPGQAGELELAERYTYDDIRFDATLTAIDFDPANPAYEFTRF